MQYEPSNYCSDYSQKTKPRGIEISPTPVGELLADLHGYLVVVPVDLVAHEDPEDLGRGVLLDLPQPVGAAVEGGLVGDVVDEDEGVGGAVVGLGDRAEPLLARRVPDLQLDLLPVDLHRLDHEVHADGGALPGGEHALDTAMIRQRKGGGTIEEENVWNLCKAADEAGFAHASVAHQHNLV